MHDGVLHRGAKVRSMATSYYDKAIDRLELHQGDEVVVYEPILTRKKES